jgi:3-deoxy-D-arabino-heptulosonate 7-phosphate (DAHP) synthase class II
MYTNTGFDRQLSMHQVMADYFKRQLDPCTLKNKAELTNAVAIYAIKEGIVESILTTDNVELRDRLNGATEEGGKLTLTLGGKSYVIPCLPADVAIAHAVHHGLLWKYEQISHDVISTPVTHTRFLHKAFAEYAVAALLDRTEPPLWQIIAYGGGQLCTGDID